MADRPPRHPARRNHQARTEGNSLIHHDVRMANLRCHHNRLVLADSAAAAMGNPWLNHHLWPVTKRAEGGPAPETGQVLGHRG
ncbi:MAG TPA: hypothetical protein VH912_22215 [Streptosporangiaceae bacterium]